MATWSTSATLAQTSNATFQAWVNEVYSSLVTQCGLPQLSALMDTGQMAVPSVTAVPVGASASAGYYMFSFNDALSKGPLVTASALLALTGGTGYDGGGSGTFTNVAGSGGTGSGAAFTVVVASGVITSITPTTAGTGYLVGDQIIITSANMVSAGAAAGGGSSGFAFVGKLTAAASPVVIKLELGSGSAAADPQMWCTVGTSWTSSGTVGAASNGAVTTRCAILFGGAPISTVSSYISRYCYNSTYGALGLCFKQSSITAATPQGPAGLWIITRSTDNSGSPISAGVEVLTTAANASSPGNGTNGFAQCISYTANTLIPATPVAGCLSFAGAYVFTLASTLENGTVFAVPLYMVDPVVRFTAFVGVALLTEVPLGVTAQFAFIGTTPLTFIQVGWASNSSGLGFGNGNGAAGVLMLWM